jgi:hypothetical protein
MGNGMNVHLNQWSPQTFAQSPYTNWNAGTSPIQPPKPTPPVIVNPSLVPNPYNITQPKIRWDLSRHPSMGKYYHANHTIGHIPWEDIATHPAVEEIHIAMSKDNVFTLPRQWGNVIVRPGRTVKVIDVLQALHDFFHQPLTRRERHAYLEAHPGSRESLQSCIERRRCEHSDCIPERELKEAWWGRRVDLLGENRLWGGVVFAYNPGNTWVLELHLGPVFGE